MQHCLHITLSDYNSGSQTLDLKVGPSKVKVNQKSSKWFLVHKHETK